MLFFCSPSAIDLQDLLYQGVYLADIPIHDATRDLLLLSERFATEYEYARQLETMTNLLQSRYLELEDEKQRPTGNITSKLSYRLFLCYIDIYDQKKVQQKIMAVLV